MVPPLRPDVAIVHAQRADAGGDAQIWGLLGCQKEAAFAADRVIVVVEEVVDEAVIRADPNRTVIPGAIVDAVVEEPFACHPSFAQGYYDRDNAFYLEWDRIARDPATLDAWLDEWVYGLANHAGSTSRRWGDAHWDALRPDAGDVRRGRLREVRVSDRRRPRLLEVRDHDRRERAAAGRRARTASSAWACRTSSATWRSGPCPPTCSSSTSRARTALGPSGCRCRSATRRSRPARPPSRRCSSCSRTTCRPG